MGKIGANVLSYDNERVLGVAGDVFDKTYIHKCHPGAYKLLGNHGPHAWAMLGTSLLTLYSASCKEKSNITD